MTDLIKYDFHGNQIQMIKFEDKIYVALRPIVEAIGLNWSGQLQRIKSHDVLNSTVWNFHTVGADGRK